MNLSLPVRVLRALSAGTSVVVLGLSLYSAPTSGDWQPGRLEPRVVCQNDPTQSYALYLPSNYDPSRKWPILFAFDPAAQGARPVEIFRKAAEEHGYIVVCSNNSENGPGELIQRAMVALWNDTQARLSIDPNRIYTAGLSGGAWPALWLARTARGAGLVLCSSPLTPERFDLDHKGRVVFGTAGASDFNYPYVQALCEALEKRGEPSRFEAFEGGHSWLPEALAAHALDTFEVYAMRWGLRQTDSQLVETLYRRALERAQQLEASGKVHEAGHAYRAASRDFDGIRASVDLAAKASALESSREFKDATKRDRRMAQAQEERLGTLAGYRSVLENPGPTAAIELQEPLAALQRIRAEIKDLEKRTKDGPEDGRLLAQRVLSAFYLETWLTGKEHLFRSEFKEAITNFDICAIMRPKAPFLHYEWGRLHALRGEPSKALESLARAVEYGFTSAQRLDEDKAFDGLRETAEFQRLVAKLRDR